MRGSAVYRERAPVVAALREHFGVLRPREREVMTLRYCSGMAPPTLDVIAARLGVTRARVQQLEFTALLRLGADIHRDRVVVRCAGCNHARVAHHYQSAHRAREQCNAPMCPCERFTGQGAAQRRAARPSAAARARAIMRKGGR